MLYIYIYSIFTQNANELHYLPKESIADKANSLQHVMVHNIPILHVWCTQKVYLYLA